MHAKLMAVIDALRGELGLSVPDDVVGFDDVPQADWGAFRLTPIVQSVELMVAATAET